jgi:dolichyl-phosphate-mannose-protein mannosyltransferase
VTRGPLVAALLLVAILGSRVPFAAHQLWAHDSVLYASAIEQGFHVDDDLRDQRPHPPGYILYVASANAVHQAGLDSNASLVLVSAVASAIGAALLFLMARRRVGGGPALVVALAYAVNPLVWSYSEVAYPYTVLGLGSIAVAWSCVSARARGLRAGILAGIALGISGGFRQDLLILLLPLWLWCVAPLGHRRAWIATSAVVGTCLLWLLPTVALSGGPSEYFDALRGQAAYVRDAYSIVAQGWPALVANVGATGYAVLWGLLAMAPLALAATLVFARRAWRERSFDELTFVLLWSFPALALYAVLHIGEWGYVLSALPGLYLLGALALERIAREIGRRPTLATSWGALVVAPALLFVLAPGPFSAAAIERHDRELQSRFAYVRENFPARTTMILTREDFLLVRYYLSEYRARQYDPEPFVKPWRKMRTARVEHVVVFTQGLVPDQAVDVRRVICSKGIELVYVDVVPGSILEFRGERYAVAGPTP